jgi:uncharacterized protein (TIGR02001 family)
MKNACLALATAVTTASVLGADEAPSRAYSVTADVSYASKYTFRGTLIGGAAVQPSVELAVGDFYAGYWGSQPVRYSGGDEADFYAGYGLTLAEGFSLDAGLTLYNYTATPSSWPGFKYTLEGYIGAKFETSAGLTPSLYAYYDFNLKTTNLQGNLEYSLELVKDTVSLDFAAYLGWGNQAAGTLNETNGHYWFWGIDLSLPYTLAPNATLTPALHYTSNSKYYGKEHKTVFSYTVGISIGF